jgi:hypothetical protein
MKRPGEYYNDHCHHALRRLLLLPVSFGLSGDMNNRPTKAVGGEQA